MPCASAEARFDLLLSSVTDFSIRRLDPKSDDVTERMVILEEFGKTLFGKLFAGDVGKLRTRLLEDVEFLHIRLQFSESAAALEAVPWETLHDGAEFIAAGEKSMVSRFCPEAKEHRPRNPLRSPVRMLGVFASPLDLDSNERLDIEREERILLEAIDAPASQGRLEIEIEDEAKPYILRNILTKGFDLLHFTGHGLSPEQGGGLLLENDLGNKRPTSAAEVLELLHPEHTELRLVVLSTCLSARSSTVGVSYNLLRLLSGAGVPHVVAMAFPILDLSALAFAERFYAEILGGASLEMAIHRTRRTLLAHQDPQIRPDALALVYSGAGGIFIEPAGESFHAKSDSTQAPKVIRKPEVDVFYGRRREVRRLRDAICGSDYRGILIHGMGGVGKTSLVSRVLERLGNRFQIVNLDAADGEGSPELIVLGLHRLSRMGRGSALGPIVHGMPSSRDRVEAVCATLHERPIIIALENFESSLSPAVSPRPGHIFKDASLEEFLTAVLNRDIGFSKFVFLSRYRVHLATTALSEIRLQDLSWPEAMGLMQTRPGLSNLSREDKRRVYLTFGGNPHALLLLDHRCASDPMDDLQEAISYVHDEAREHAAIALNFQSLSETSANLLVSVSAFSGSFHRCFASWLVEGVLECDVDTRLQELESWGLVHSVGGRYLLAVHPLVRDFCRDKAGPSVWQVCLMNAAGCLKRHRETADEIYEVVKSILAEYDLLCEAECFTEAANLLIESHPQLHRFGLGSRLEVEYEDLMDRVPPQAQLYLRYQRALLSQSRGEYDLAFQEYQFVQRHAVATGDRAMEMYTHHQIARIQVEWRQWDDAFEGYRKALEIARTLGSRTQISITLHQIGVLHQARGRNSEARRAYEESLEIKMEQSDLAGAARTLHQLGTVLQTEGHFEEALDVYHHALSVKKQVGDRLGIAHTIQQIGVIKLERGELEPALRCFEQALVILEELQFHSDLPVSFMYIARVYRTTGETDEALRYYRKAIDLAARLKDHLWAESTLLEMAQLCLSKERWSEAREAFEQLLPRLRSRGDLALLAFAILNLGRVEEGDGRKERAVCLYQEILSMQELRGFETYGLAQDRLARIAEQEGRQEEAHKLFEESSMDLGKIAFLQGRLKEAIDYFSLAQKVAVVSDDRPAEAEALRMLSEAFLRIGDMPRAARACKMATEAYSDLDDEKNIGKCRHIRGMILFYLNDHEGALEEYEKALAIAEKVPDERDVARVLHQIGIIYQLLSKKDMARSRFERSLGIARKLEDHEQISASLHHLGHLLDDERRYEDALQHYEESLKIKREHGMGTFIGVSLFAIAKMNFMLGNLEQALRPMIEAHTLAQETGIVSEEDVREVVGALRQGMGHDRFVQAWRFFTGIDPPAELF